MDDSIVEYGRRVAEAVYNFCDREWALPGCWDRDKDDIMEEVANVPKPEAQHHDAPTCAGWWWATHRRKWRVVNVQGERVFLPGTLTSFDIDEFGRWVGPLLPPDTTTPAPDVQAQIGAAVAREREECAKWLETLASIHNKWTWEHAYKNAAMQIRARSGAKGVQRTVDCFPLTPEMLDKIRREVASRERPIVWPVGAAIPIKDAP